MQIADSVASSSSNRMAAAAHPLHIPNTSAGARGSPTERGYGCGHVVSLSCKYYVRFRHFLDHLGGSPHVGRSQLCVLESLDGTVKCVNKVVEC